MSDNDQVFSDGNDQKTKKVNSEEIVTSERVVYGLVPISEASAVAGWKVASTVGVGSTGSLAMGIGGSSEVLVSPAYSVEAKHSELEQSSKYIAELDDILTQLHEEDDYIARDRQEIKRLGKETKAMLTELRKQLG